MLEGKEGEVVEPSKGISIPQHFGSASSMNRKVYFNEAAETWDQRFCTPELAAFLERLVSRFGLKPGYKVLDVGTGTGVLIPFLLKEIGPSGSVTAIDFAERMVQVCRSKYSHLKNVTVELHDVEEEDLPPAYFDAVTCFGVFPHLEKKEKMLRNVNRALKSGGILIIAHALGSQEIKDHHKKASFLVANDTLPESAEMKQLLNQTGFTEISIEDKPGCYLCLSRKR
jgi:demethylmenaquinone methyltransferase/2-methoxy-6-polyprenyl-1,4-benzoquinol methylase